MASRVCSRPTLPATCLPCPSGPRWARRRAMASSRFASTGVAETTPAIPHMLIPCRAPVFDRHGVQNALTRAAGGNSRSERIDHRLDQTTLELERGLVDHQARTDVADVLDRDQAVGLERAAGGDEIDDDVGQSDQRRELHRAIQLDEVDVYALAGEMLACRVDVFGSDADARAL